MILALLSSVITTLGVLGLYHYDQLTGWPALILLLFILGSMSYLFESTSRRPYIEIVILFELVAIGVLTSAIISTEGYNELMLSYFYVISLFYCIKPSYALLYYVNVDKSKIILYTLLIFVPLAPFLWVIASLAFWFKFKIPARSRYLPLFVCIISALNIGADILLIIFIQFGPFGYAVARMLIFILVSIPSFFILSCFVIYTELKKRYLASDKLLIMVLFPFFPKFLLALFISTCVYDCIKLSKNIEVPQFDVNK